MAQFIRNNKLTDNAYSPTTAVSEAAIRSQVDGSVQEISDILYSRDNGKGASQVGIEGTSWPDVQAMATAVNAAGTGTIPPADSVGNAQLATDVKVGSLATLNALLTGFTSSVTVAINKIVSWVGDLTTLTTTVKTSLVESINEVDADLSTVNTTLNIIRTAKLDTGTANAYLVDTDGTFDLTKDGNTITFIPNNTNTGASTINFDTQSAVTIQKADSTGTLVALEAGDLLKNRPATIVRRVGTNVFILRPSGGSNIKSIQRGITTLSTTSVSQAVSTVDTTKSMLFFTYKTTNNNDGGEKVATKGVIASATSLTFSRTTTSTDITIYWTLIEFNNVKSLQTGTTSVNVSGANVTITAVDQLKCLVISSMTVDASSTPPAMTYGADLTSATNLVLTNPTGTIKSIYWRIIEFN